MRRQESYSVLWGSPTDRANADHLVFNTNEEAKQARDNRYVELKSQGVKARRSILRNQLRKYWGFGSDCGQVCHVYELEYDIED